MKRCPTCGRSAPDDLTFCVDDGASLEATAVKTLADLTVSEGPIALLRVLRLARGLCAAWEPLRMGGRVPPAVSPLEVEVHEGDRISVTVAWGEAPTIVGDHGLAPAVSFAAPETFPGGGGVTEATSVYHVAALVYYLLTGHAPFEGSSRAAIAVRKLLEDPPSPRGLRSDVPASLDAVIVRALDRDPTRRFATIAELTAAFEAVTSEVSTIAQGPVWCSRCGTPPSVGARFCPNDGAALWTHGAVEDLHTRLPESGTSTEVKPFGAGKYRCEARIGEGGMGVVYRACDVQTGMVCAVKVLFAQGRAEGPRVERFRKEARLAAAVRHPNCVAIYDYGEVAGRLFYLVMEWVDGRSLDAVLDGRAMALERVVAIVEQVCAALAAVHAAGIVHRDLKPHNVMLCDGDVVKLIDFGIARDLNAAAITCAGVIVGTPAYMAPEQARGEAVDERADVFSLGVMTWELLTGRPPFDPAESTIQQILARAMLQEPVAPTGVSCAVDTVLRRATEPDRTRRTPDVSTFSRELRATLQSKAA